MTRENRFQGLKWAATALAGVSAAGGGLAIWLGYGVPLCREGWQGFANLLALAPSQAAALIAALLGG